MSEILPIERVENRIFLIRGQKVMLDFHLADLYGVETGQLKRQVKRNNKRFPEDFMFLLSKEEDDILRCQIGISNRGGRRYLPYAFTEQGVAMLSSVLKSERAIDVNILIMRAFIKIKQALATHKEVSRKLYELEQRLDKHDTQIFAILDAIRKMVEPEARPAKKIGFRPNNE